MEFLNRRRQRDEAGNGLPGGQPGGNLDDLRMAAQGFIAAGNEAINRALSNGNSEAFLNASRQEGGQ